MGKISGCTIKKGLKANDYDRLTFFFFKKRRGKTTFSAVSGGREVLKRTVKGCFQNFLGGGWVAPPPPTINHQSQNKRGGGVGGELGGGDPLPIFVPGVVPTSPRKKVFVFFLFYKSPSPRNRIKTRFPLFALKKKKKTN